MFNIPIFNIINDIEKTVSVEYAKRLLFWVFNRVESEKGNNTALIKQLKEDIDANIDLFKKGDILLTQFENSMETVQYIIEKAHEKEMIIVLNPAPIKKFDESYFKYIDYLVPNEHELEALTGTTNILEGCEKLLAKGAKNVIATLGDKGSILVNKNGNHKVEPHKVDAVDTTAAGDSYLGALVSKLAENAGIIEAMEYASLASSYTVTKQGAIVALPHLKDLKRQK